MWRYRNGCVPSNIRKANVIQCWNGVYAGRANIYSFIWKGKHIKLLPISFRVEQKSKTEVNPPLSVSESGLLVAYKKRSLLAVVVREEQKSSSNFSISVLHLLAEFEDVRRNELSSGLPPLRSIQLCIDFVPNASLLNLPHYKMSPKEHQALQKIVEEL